MRPAYRQSRAASRADEKGSKDRFAAHEAVWLGEYSGCRELIERFYVGELPSAPLGDQALCAVLEPPEFVCSFCAEQPCLRTESDDRRAHGKLLVLTENGVLPGEAYLRTCPRCDARA